jgi:cellulose biosynthesis protein BcsQ
MTLTIAFASLKGGVGKTTTALNCAYAFARRGSRTLLVDTDPQGAIGLSLDGVGDRAGLAASLNDGDHSSHAKATSCGASSIAASTSTTWCCSIPPPGWAV